MAIGTTDEGLSARVKAVREGLGMTQQEVADASGTLDRTEVVAIENSRNRCTSARVQSALARAFGVHNVAIAALLVGTKTPDEVVALSKRKPKSAGPATPAQAGA